MRKRGRGGASDKAALSTDVWLMGEDLLGELPGVGAIWLSREKKRRGPGGIDDVSPNARWSSDT